MYEQLSRRQAQVGDNDYYGLLGLEFGASHNEIVIAYRNLARRFHPDKNTTQGARLKEEAEEQFRRIKNAYEVLSDPNKRIIYNEFGVDGLKYQGLALEKKLMTASELHEQFEKLQKQIIDNKLAVQAKPYASFTVGIDASSLFMNSEDEEFDEDNDLKEEVTIINLRGIEISSMSANMRVENEIALNHNLTLNGNLNAKNGTGDGTFGFGYSFKYSKHTLFHLNNLFGSPPSVSVGFQHALTEKTSVGGECFLLIHSYEMIPGMELNLSHVIRNDLEAKVSYREGSNSSLRTSIIYINQRLMFEVTTAYKISLLSHRMTVDFGYKFNEGNSRLSLSLSGDTQRGVSIAYGCQTRVLDINVVGATLALNVPSGVTLKLRYVRANQEFNLPIYLSDEITSGPLFYGTIIPLVAYFVVDRCYFRFFKPNKNIFATP